MANVLHRQTLEYLPSVNTPDYPPEDWLINPDMSAVADVPRWQWVIDGDTLRPADEDERAVLEAARMPDWRRDRIAAIDARTKTIVASGVEIAPGKVVGTTIEATQNLQNLVLGVNLGTLDLPQDISTTDGGSYTITGSGDLVRVAGLLTAHQRSALDAGRVAASRERG